MIKETVRASLVPVVVSPRVVVVHRWSKRWVARAAKYVIRRRRHVRLHRWLRRKRPRWRGIGARAGDGIAATLRRRRWWVVGVRGRCVAALLWWRWRLLAVAAVGLLWRRGRAVGVGLARGRVWIGLHDGETEE